MPRDDDPVAARSPLAAWLFTRYLRWWYFRRAFHALRLSGAAPRTPPGRPVIICSNHPSWWDPAVYVLLMPALFPGRIGYGPMEAASLRRYGLFRRLGVFGIEPDSRRGAARFLQVASRLLADPRTVLWVTAEGRFTDPRHRPVRLRPGLAHLARRQENAVILPVALEYCFWDERLPEALVRIGPPIEADAGRSVAAWTASLEAALTATMDALAGEAMSREPARFRRLVGGRVGVGGLYDLYRRLAASPGAGRFDPSHRGREP